MMKTILLLLLPLVCLAACTPKEDAPVPSVPGTETVTEIQRDYKQGHIAASMVSMDGNIVACGIDENSQPMVLKVSARTGTTLWSKAFKDTQVGVLSSITQMKDGNYSICGTVTSDSGDYDVRTTQLNNVGEIVWQKTSGNEEDEISPRVGMAFGTSFLCAAREAAGGHDIVFAFLSGSSAVLGDTFPLSGHQVPYHVTYTTLNTVAIVASSRSTLTAPSNVIVASYSNTKKVKELTLDGGSAIPRHSIPLPDNNILICGSTSIAGKCRGFIARTSDIGDMVWHKEYSADNNMLLNYVAEDRDGFVAVGHLFNSEEHGTTECVIVKMDKDGNEVWRQTLGRKPDINDEAVSVRRKDSGEYSILCNSTDRSNGNAPAYRYFMTSISAPDPK